MLDNNGFIEGCSQILSGLVVLQALAVGERSFAALAFFASLAICS
jgi:hypothetical protein